MNEKEKFYFERTIEHIHRVHKNMFTLITKHSDALELTVEDCRVLAQQVLHHDISKFGTKQFIPYIEMTEFHRQRKTLGNTTYEYPNPDMATYVDSAIHDHYLSENHHLERVIETGGRMTKFEIIEIVCDLQAMAQEFGEGSCRGFYDNVWRKKYIKLNALPDDYEWFSMTSLMETVITCFEKDINWHI